MTFLFTGATGDVGSRVVEHLIELANARGCLYATRPKRKRVSGIVSRSSSVILGIRHPFPFQ